MSNYDFGYDIHAGSTMEWAINIIQSRSEILELGPAIGTLTKHLKEDKKCMVDIVEIDQEAGDRALKFARNACIGSVNGNLEYDFWYEKLKGNKYDYVVVLDVLEHLKDASEVLLRVKSLLKDDGELILSLPNIAHNSVILELLQNKFDYTKVGLLDETHLHFYTYETLCKLIQNSGLSIFEQKALQMRVGENEIKNSYQDVPMHVAAFLRTREYADVYQFLFRIKKENSDIVREKMKVSNLPYTLYQFIVLNSKAEQIWVEFINPKHKMRVRFSTSEEGDLIRITPLNDYCVIENLHIRGIDLEKNVLELDVKQTTAAVMENEYVFMDQDPQIFIEKPQGIIEIEIEGNFLSYGDESVCCVLPFWKKILEQNVIIRDYEKILYNLNK